MGWQRTSGYNARAGAEGAMSRYKRIIGDTLRSHTRPRRPASPSAFSTACSTSDARNPSAPPDDQETKAALRSLASVHQSSVRITRVRAARDVQRQRLPVLPLCAIGDHQGLAIATLAEGCWMRPDVSGDSGFEASDEDCVSAAV